MGILDDWHIRWHTLSHGERKRAQIAVALWQQPDVLALDEPTNHIDTDARLMLASALREYRGIGLLISHDRDLPDSLYRKCLFLNPPESVMRPGNYSSGRREGLFRLPEGTIVLGGSRKLQHPGLVMRPTDRIALTGANGSGKSTWIRHILGTIPAKSSWRTGRCTAWVSCPSTNGIGAPARCRYFPPMRVCF